MTEYQIAGIRLGPAHEHLAADTARGARVEFGLEVHVEVYLPKDCNSAEKTAIATIVPGGNDYVDIARWVLFGVGEARCGDCNRRCCGAGAQQAAA